MKKRLLLALACCSLLLTPALSTAAPDIYFTLYTGKNTQVGNHTISGQISAITNQDKRTVGRTYPLKGAPIFVMGPDRGPRKNTIYRGTRTDERGRYAIDVKIPGRYKIFIDPGWAKIHGIRALAVRGGEILKGDQILVEPGAQISQKQGKVFGLQPEGYVINEKIAIVTSNGREQPIAGVVVYIHGPLPLSPHKPDVMLTARTNSQGYYRVRVKTPGTYEISIDPGSAIHHGAYRWTPDSYRILVK